MGEFGARQLVRKRKRFKWRSTKYKVKKLQLWRKTPLEGAPAGRAIVLKKRGVEQKQPHSGLIKCVKVQLIKNGKVVTAHTLRDTRYKRYILPEHEAEFREHSTSRHVLSEQFLRLGPATRDFHDGLIAEHGGAAGYHISRILALAERVGAPRVAEALRHAVRYGAFDYNAVARIVTGKTDKPLTAPTSVGPLPQRIHEYLRGAGEHQRPLRDYDQLLRKLTKDPDDGK